MLQGAAIITKLKLKIFDPKFLQQVSHKYAPNQVQIEVGNSPGKYDYQSRIFDVEQGTSEE